VCVRVWGCSTSATIEDGATRNVLDSHGSAMWTSDLGKESERSRGTGRESWGGATTSATTSTLQRTAAHCNKLQHTHDLRTSASATTTTQTHASPPASAYPTPAGDLNLKRGKLSATASTPAPYSLHDPHGREGHGSASLPVTLPMTLPHTLHECTRLQHTAAHCNTLQRTATHCSTLQHTHTSPVTLPHVSRESTRLQHTATHCNTLQHTATHTHVLRESTRLPSELERVFTQRQARRQGQSQSLGMHHEGEDVGACSSRIAGAAATDPTQAQSAAVHCNTLQHTATHCDAPQRSAARCNTHTHAQSVAALRGSVGVGVGGGAVGWDGDAKTSAALSFQQGRQFMMA